MTIHIIQAVPIIWIYEWKNTCQVMALNTQKKDFLFNLYIMKSLKIFLMLTSARDKFTDGQEEKKKCLIEGKFDKLKGLGRR